MLLKLLINIQIWIKSHIWVFQNEICAPDPTTSGSAFGKGGMAIWHTGHCPGRPVSSRGWSTQQVFFPHIIGRSGPNMPGLIFFFSPPLAFGNAFLSRIQMKSKFGVFQCSKVKICIGLMLNIRISLSPL